MASRWAIAKEVLASEIDVWNFTINFSTAALNVGSPRTPQRATSADAKCRRPPTPRAASPKRLAALSIEVDVDGELRAKVRLAAAPRRRRQGAPVASARRCASLVHRCTRSWRRSRSAAAFTDPTAASPKLASPYKDARRSPSPLKRGFKKQAASFTDVGRKRENQDRWLMVERFAGLADATLAAVLDGHGEYGAEVAAWCKDELVEVAPAGGRPATTCAPAARRRSSRRDHRRLRRDGCRADGGGRRVGRRCRGVRGRARARRRVLGHDGDARAAARHEALHGQPRRQSRRPRVHAPPTARLPRWRAALAAERDPRAAGVGERARRQGEGGRARDGRREDGRAGAILGRRRRPQDVHRGGCDGGDGI